MTERTNEAALWPTAHQAIMAGQSPEIPGPVDGRLAETTERERLANACVCGDCYHPAFGPNTDGDPCDWCRDCACSRADHEVIDRHGDVWTPGDDGLMHTPETAPFSREHVEKKWGPLTLMRMSLPPASPTQPAANQEPGA